MTTKKVMVVLAVLIALASAGYQNTYSYLDSTTCSPADSPYTVTSVSTSVCAAIPCGGAGSGNSGLTTCTADAPSYPGPNYLKYTMFANSDCTGDINGVSYSRIDCNPFVTSSSKYYCRSDGLLTLNVYTAAVDCTGDYISSIVPTDCSSGTTTACNANAAGRLSVSAVTLIAVVSAVAAVLLGW